MGNIQYLQLQYRDGLLVLKDANGEYINDPLEFHQILQDMQYAFRALLGGHTQEALLKAQYSDTLDRLLTEVREWIFHDIDCFVYQANGKSRNRKLSHTGACVYFLEHPSRPNQLKIGQTIDLYARSKVFYREWDGNDPVTLHAVAITDRHVTTERILHRYFEEYKIDGEWFQPEPIFDWLSRIRMGVSAA